MTFNMQRIGRTIAKLRHKSNMTQMQLADEIGVSFQAISNWERGQSMPDISKLPELAELFSVSIDALLGHDAPLIERAVTGTLEQHLETLTANGLPVSTEEISEVAPLLPPSQVDQLTKYLPDITALLPFLSTEKVDSLLMQSFEKGESVVKYAPFSSEEAIQEIVHKLEIQGKSITSLLPFLSEKEIDSLALARLKDGKDINNMLPFISNDLLNKLADKITESC